MIGGTEQHAENDPVRMISESRLAAILSGVPGTPRVVASGNFATPIRALAVLDGTLAAYRLFVLNAQHGIPSRDGVTLETPFVGPGMRGRAGLRYFPSRLSLVPTLLTGTLPPDIVLLHTSTPVEGTVSLGTEVNILPAAVDAAPRPGRAGDRPTQPADALHLRGRGADHRRDRLRDRDRRTWPARSLGR